MSRFFRDILPSGSLIHLRCPIPPSNTFQASITRPCLTSKPTSLYQIPNTKTASPFLVCPWKPLNSHFHHTPLHQTHLEEQQHKGIKNILNMNPEDDMNDPDLRAAIQASLMDINFNNGSENNASSTTTPASRQNQNQSQNQNQGGGVVDLTGESDDDEVVEVFPKSNERIGSETDEDDEGDGELMRAIQMSMQGSGRDRNDEDELVELPHPPKENHHGNETATAMQNQQAPPGPIGLLGLDRRKMEEERLARCAKRKASNSSIMEQNRLKYLKIGESSRSSAGEGPVKSNANQTGSAQQGVPSNSPEVQFPNGVVKKTWAFGCSRKGDDIKLEEVFQQSDLELAVLSSFMWDMEWLFQKLDTRRIRFLLIMQAKEEETKRQYEADIAYMPNLRLCFPPMDGQINCMHSKLMLLYHPGYVRIVVPSANLLPFDWGEKGGFMENTVFLIDLPKRAEDSPQFRTPFYEELVYFLRASSLHENIVAKLDSFDFSKTAHIAFIHTIGGSHFDEAQRRTGYCGLGRAVSSLGLRSSLVNIDVVTSSLGSLTSEFLRSIYLAAQGDEGMTEFALRTAKSFPAKRYDDPNKFIQRNTAAEWIDRFRAYFPSQTTVNESIGGPRNAGTICFQQRWWEGTKFPRHVLRDCQSQRPARLMHNKIIYVRPDEPISMPDNSRCRAWAYVGSANLSESAWGRLVQDRSTKKPKLNCRNWECGVLIPVIDKERESSPASTQTGSTDDGAEKNVNQVESANMLDVFQGTIPIPMQLPGRRFGPGLKPWYFLF